MNPDPKQIAPFLLTARELAAALRVSETQVKRLRREGLPVVWVGCSPRFDWDAARTWLAARVQKPAGRVGTAETPPTPRLIRSPRSRCSVPVTVLDVELRRLANGG